MKKKHISRWIAALLAGVLTCTAFTGCAALTKESAADITHPVAQQRIAEHFYFGNIACRTRGAHTGEQNIKIASVVSDVEHGSVGRYLFLSDHGDGSACQKQADAECPVDDLLGTSVLQIHVRLPDDPFDQQKRNTQDQK